MSNWKPEDNCIVDNTNAVVKMIDGDFVVCKLSNGGSLGVYHVDDVKPPRTPEQQKRDEAMRKINNEFMHHHGNGLQFVEHLLNIGLIQLPCDDVVALSFSEFDKLGGITLEAGFNWLAENNRIKVKQ